MEGNTRLRPYKILLTMVVAILSTIFFTYIIFFYVQESLNALTTPFITAQLTTDDSSVIRNESTVSVDLSANKNEVLYKARTTGRTAALEFLQKSPKVTGDMISGAQVQAISSIIPENFVENSLETRGFRDEDDEFLKERDLRLNAEHYCFNQLLPVDNKKLSLYAGVVCVHIKNASEVYAVSGSTTLSYKVQDTLLSDQQAEEKGVQYAKDLQQSDEELSILKTEKVVFNKKIVGIDDDERNYLATVYTIVAGTDESMLANRYFVNMSDGNLLFVDPISKQALNRQVRYGLCQRAGNCYSPSSCPVVRAEGQPATNKEDVDKAYDYLGETYNLFKNSFNRDSYNNAGAALNTFVTTEACNNAAWTTMSCQQMYICKGMSGRDVLAHELTHAVTENTAGLIYQNQSGALNEAFSDIFGQTVDNDDWSIGEETVLGIIRFMDDPARAQGGPYYTPQPDRLFSEYYKCVNPGAACVPGKPANGGNDNCWVHANSGVLNHAFYLMVEGTAQKAGGKYNGCSITGVGREKSVAIMYRALSTYLTANSNFKAVYTAVNRSCDELYPNDSATCAEVKKSLQATEMDQQPDGQGLGAKCSGKTAVTPACATNTGEPSATLIPADPSVTTTPSATRIPTLPVSLTPGPSATPSASPSPSPSAGVSPTPSAQRNFNIKVKFQGIAPATTGNIKMSLKLVHPDITGISKEYSATGSVVSDGTGGWVGTMTTDAPEGEKYTMLVKGQRHIQKKICTDKPTEQYPGSYRCTAGTISFKNNAAYDFSGITLLVGDLPEQDGIVNAYDISLIVNNLSKKDRDTLIKADLNMDGVVDTQDYSLMIAALSIRYDEE